MSSLLVVSNSEQATFLAITSVFTSFVLYFKSRLKNPLLWFCFGISWACINIVFWTEVSSKSVEEPRVAQVEGVICSIPVHRFDSWQFDFCLEQIENAPVNWFKRNRIKMRWGQYAIEPQTTLKAGQYWQLEVKLRPIYGKVNPLAFDYEKWLIAQGYAGTGSVRKKAKLLADSSYRDHYLQFRQSAYDHFSQLIPESDYRPLLIALLMGERSGISDSQWQVFQASGTSHLLAISGLHVGIAALWSYWLIMGIWRRLARLCLLLPAQTAGEVASLIGAISLVVLSGFGLPAQRALIMLAIVLINRWTGRHYSLLNLLALALFLILIIQPFSILSISFWLSFSAVFIIALVLSRQIGSRPQWLVWLNINWFLYLALIPISWIFFNKVSWVAIVANLILIPVSTFLLTPAIYIGALISMVSSSLAIYLFKLADLLMQVTFYFQSFLATYNLDDLPIKSSWISISAILLISLSLFLPVKSLPRFFVLPLCLLLILPLNNQSHKDLIKILVFDVGQGLAILAETEEGQLLFDTGWGRGDFATAESTLVPYIKGSALKQIDKLVVSHGDTDHSGGVKIIDNSILVKEILAGEPLPLHKAKDCHEMLGWQWSGIRYEFLAHRVSTHVEGNNSSCVLSIRTEDFSILLTGDIEKSAERRLLTNGLQPHDIIIAPHHGSNTSSTAPFIEKLQPKHVIFSTGYDNQWNFPRENVVNRYQSAGAQTWVTHKDGAVIIRLDSKGVLSVNGLRRLDPKFWR